MAVSTALFALGAGLNLAGNMAGVAGSRADLQNAPNQKRFQGNIFDSLFSGNLVLAHTEYAVPDYARVAETLEKTGYRVDRTIHNYRQDLLSFVVSMANRKYWIPLQFTAQFSCLAVVPQSVLDDVAMRCANGIRFHRVTTSGVSEIGADLKYDNVEE